MTQVAVALALEKTAEMTPSITKALDKKAGAPTPMRMEHEFPPEEDHAAAHISSSSRSSSSSSLSASDEAKEPSSSRIMGDEDHEAVEYPKEVLGVPVTLDVKKTRGKKLYGLRVKCPNLAHKALGCNKYRSCMRDLGPFGHGAELYLQTWMSKATVMEAAAHRSWRPTTAEIKEYIETRTTGGS